VTVIRSFDDPALAWRSVLPPGRRYVALPSRSRPVIVAERTRGALRYTREALLASPPGSRAPDWAYEGARRLLRFTPAWRAAPTVTSRRAPAGSWQAELANWIELTGHRVIALRHSSDADAGSVLLLLSDGTPDLGIAIKVPGGPDAAARIARERRRLQDLARAPLERVASSVPRIVVLPGALDRHVVATTAQPGTPMYVSYHRNGRTRHPDRVRADFDAAASWLANLQAAPTSAAVPLDVSTATLAAAVERIDEPGERRAVLNGLAGVRRRLRVHRAARCVVHGDFWAGNILIRDDRVTGVVDWERWDGAGSPIRDIGRFAVAYSTYLDRHTRDGHHVRGHDGLVAGCPFGGVGYALTGTGWYPRTVRSFVTRSLVRVGLPAALGRDVVLSELAAVAAESSDPTFAARTWSQFGRLCELER
jgi:aminoglycoside phosphotransferase